MHKLTMYENLRDKIDTELADIEKDGITKENLDHLYKLSMSLKAVDKHIECLEEYEEMNGEHSYNYPRYSMRGAKRNALGQYSRDWPYMHQYPSYSRDDAKHKMIQKLETLKDDTMSEHERSAIQDCINKINM